MINNKNHLGNLSVLAGHNVTKYDYLLTEDDLLKAWVTAHNSLGYPLKKESARDRYLIYNKQGLQKEIDTILTNLITQEASTISDFVEDNSSQVVQDVLDSINLLGNNYTINKAATSKNKSIASKLGHLMGRAIGKAGEDIFKLISED